MKPSLFATALAVLIFSCSKPSQENSSSSDTTDAGQTSGNESASAEGGALVDLSPEEEVRVADELFVIIHNAMVPSNKVALKEEFSVEGNVFKYSLISHNLENYGVESTSWNGNRQPTDEEIAAYEADTSENKQYPVGEGYTQTNYYYTSQIDTFYIDGKFIARADNPESGPRVLTIALVDGGVVHQNAAEVGEDGVPVFASKEYYYVNPLDGPNFLGGDFFEMDLSQPLEFKKDDLYLKAKIKDLTEADIAGLSKEELSFVRNDIFARHGHIFKTTKMVTRYQTADWYHPIISDAAGLLNKFEKRNVEFLKKREG